MTPFHNNLLQNDRVFDTVSKRQAKVARSPRSPGARYTAIIFDGTNSPRYIDVMQLRFMPDGKTPEDLAPVDGEPPDFDEPKPPQPAPPQGRPSLLETANAEREWLEERIKEMSDLAREHRVRIERLDAAIKALEGKP